MEADQLKLRYQPIVRLASGGLPGCEALVRWQHPRLGLIGPNEFIPLAERSRLIHRIGNWVLNRALDDWPALRSRCQAAPGERPFVSVNMSAPELSAPGIADTILEALAARGIDLAELRIELTETTVIANLQQVAAVAQRLRRLGWASRWTTSALATPA